MDIEDVVDAAADAAAKGSPMGQPHFIPAERTPVTIEQMRDALGNAWRAQFGEEPNDRALIVLVAHWSLETGSGASMWCFNVGNIKGRPNGSDGHSWTFFRCNEIINGNVQWFDPPHPQTCFRAYESLDEGVADYLALVHRRFFKSWPAVVNGDPAAYARALKAQHYYTANEAAYTRTLVNLFNQYIERFSGYDLSSRANVADALTKLGYVATDYLAAVRSFQRDHELVDDGKVGPLTRSAIIAALQGMA